MSRHLSQVNVCINLSPSPSEESLEELQAGRHYFAEHDQACQKQCASHTVGRHSCERTRLKPISQAGDGESLTSLLPMRLPGCRPPCAKGKAAARPTQVTSRDSGVPPDKCFVRWTSQTYGPSSGFAFLFPPFSLPRFSVVPPSSFGSCLPRVARLLLLPLAPAVGALPPRGVAGKWLRAALLPPRLLVALGRPRGPVPHRAQQRIVSTAILWREAWWRWTAKVMSRTPTDAGRQRLGRGHRQHHCDDTIQRDAGYDAP